jgi:hypothetical protein
MTLSASSAETGVSPSGGAPPPAVRRLPPWLRQNLGAGGGHGETAGLIAELNLETVCSSAKCPNRLECWSQKTATFMILGNVCTRPCGFCSVPKGKTEVLEHDEPERVENRDAPLRAQPSGNSRERVQYGVAGARIHRTMLAQASRAEPSLDSPSVPGGPPDGRPPGAIQRVATPFRRFRVAAS